ncbi:hypothetical protein [Sphingomonas sp. 28-62-11]|uniref:hypothetical protein n=1 Tax=Sphingomonas sp. 28-62-11 TaxID=1970432 RepID=UPI0035A965B5
MAVQQDRQGNPAVEFVGGVGEGLYGVAEGVVTGAYAALTTNPATTARNAVLGIANTIDAAIAAEETPARVQVSRAARAIGNATPRDIGRAAGSVAGNLAVSAVPGTAVAKVAAARRLRMARPRPGPFPSPQIGWVRENLGRDSPAKRYNDSAPNARPGMAPTLMRTMADGSKRPVKFDGTLGEYMEDWKLKVVNAPRARAQVARQTQALEENGAIGTWVVPDEVQRAKALKLFKSMNIKNIKVRVAKP